MCSFWRKTPKTHETPTIQSRKGRYFDLSILKKLLVLMIALLMCVTCFVACDDEPEPTTTTTPTAPEGPSPVALLNQTTYSGRTCTIWQANPGYYGPQTDFYIADNQDRTTSVERASYQRIQTIKRRAGVTINVVKSEVNSAQLASPDLTELDSLFKSEVDKARYDIVIPGSHTACALMAKGYFCGLKGVYAATNDIPNNYLDFSKNCWDTNINDALSVGGEYYLVSGAYSVVNAGKAATMFIDKNMLAEINTATLAGTAAAGFTDIETIYEWVNNGTWTWSKLMALANAYTGNGTSAASEKYGLSYQATSSYSIFVSAGLEYMSKDQYDLPTYDIGNQQNVNVMNWLIDNIKDSPSTYIWGSGTGQNTGVEEFGPEHHVLFAVLGFDLVKTHSNTDAAGAEDFEFSVVPMPKFDYSEIQSSTVQDDYNGIIAAWFLHTAAIPKSASDRTFSSYVLQLMSEMGKTTYGTGVTTVYQAYIQEGLQGRYAPQDLRNHPEIIDAIMASAKVDIGEVFPWSGIEHNATIGDLVRNKYNAGDKSGLTSLQGQYEVNLTNQINKLVRDLGLYE
jgi:hypothetical protein